MSTIEVVTNIINIITALIKGIIDWVVAAMSGITDVFYTSGEEGGFTVIGVFLLLALGFSIVFFAFRFIRGLIQR